MSDYPIAMIVAGGAATYVAATVAAGLIARAGFPLPPQERRTGCIDGMRGYLALSVLIHHFLVWMQVERYGSRWYYLDTNFLNELGAGSVTLFFMTTAFVFYPRVLSGLRAWSPSVIYITRLFRIVPMTIVSIAMITGLIVLRTGHHLDRDYPIAAFIWLTTWGEPPLLSYPDSGRINAYVLWSLWYEWMFYLYVLPACALAMDLLRHRLPSWTIPLGLGFGAIALRLFDVPWSILKYLPVFVIGMLAYELHRREWMAKWARTPAASMIAALSLVVGMTIANTPSTLVLPLFGCFFTCVACGNSMGGLLRTKGALVLGECSYGIYLLHGIVLSILFVDAGRYLERIATDELPLLLPLAGTSILLITPLTYLWIERPAITAGVRLAKAVTGLRVRRDAAEQEVAP